MDSSAKHTAIETYLRIRPSNKPEEDKIYYGVKDVTAENGTERQFFSVEVPQQADPTFVHNNTDGIINFEFDRVFDESSSQEDLFVSIAQTKVEEVVNGMNSTIFAYGQTGSGKTYSMFGGDDFSARGLLPRIITQIFKEVKLRENFRIQISFTEIYNESVYDLLDPEKKSQPIEQWVPVQIYEVENQLHMRNISVFEASSEEEALSLFFLGTNNRITSSTPMNDASSRSHAIFSIVVESELIKDDQLFFCRGKLNIVDLAGSERMYKSRNSTGMIKEARAINLSLHYLEQVIISLKDARDREQQQTGKKAAALQQRNNKNKSTRKTPTDPRNNPKNCRSDGSSSSSSSSRNGGAMLMENDSHDGGSNNDDDDQVSSSPTTTVSSSSSHAVSVPNKGGQSTASFIPYRNSILTSMLRDSLGGNCRTCFLLTISADISHFGESVSTCRFGQRCGEVICKVVANAERSLIERLKEAEEKVQKLELKVEVLKEEAASLELEIKEKDELHFSVMKGNESFSDDDKSMCNLAIESIVSASSPSSTSSSSRSTLTVQSMVESFISNHSPNLPCLSYFCVELSKVMDSSRASMDTKMMELESALIEPLAVIPFPRDSAPRSNSEGSDSNQENTWNHTVHKGNAMLSAVQSSSPPEMPVVAQPPHAGSQVDQARALNTGNSDVAEVTNVEMGSKVPCPMCGFCNIRGNEDEKNGEGGRNGNHSSSSSSSSGSSSKNNENNAESTGDHTDVSNMAEEIAYNVNVATASDVTGDEISTRIPTDSVNGEEDSTRLEAHVVEEDSDAFSYQQHIGLHPPAPEPLQYKVNIEIVSPALYEILTRGSVFVKKSSVGFGRNLGLENTRTIKISNDLRYLFWADKGNVKSKFIPLACFEEVTIEPNIATGEVNENIPSYITLKSREGAKGFLFSFGNIFFPRDSKFSPTGSEMREWFQGLKTCVETSRRIFYLDHDLHTMHTCDDM